ncbi:hypothetical protein G3I59_42880 [Amycolatopsis rubida]|uniref:Uncharacterized protein n=1 Tax=Amycolatopsis rubida TaxID=112413 RepID=A0ABX0CAZ9_9PSEU|nr:MULTISPECIES: hypothetical protein [Amycolatopsis]MYW97186.1 hypothetical protein [Amycolatopsis rubida]NEC62171.1 hypothetical protein [Amycolatopsis rubida]OAP24620.1 hypothetical protein A4R44_04589 [Amycolatopsis sp. M39]
MRASNVVKLARLQGAFDAEYRQAINPDGTRNRVALLRLAELAARMVAVYEEEAALACRAANQAYDLATGK